MRAQRGGVGTRSNDLYSALLSLDLFTLGTCEMREIADFGRADGDHPWLTASCRVACTRSRARRARAAIEGTRSCTHAASAAVRRSRFPRLCEIVGTRQRRPSRSARRRVAPQGSIASHISWLRRSCSRPPARISITRVRRISRGGQRQEMCANPMTYARDEFTTRGRVKRLQSRRLGGMSARDAYLRRYAPGR